MDLVHFKKHELTCRCWCGAMPRQHAMEALDKLRHKYGKPLIINSGKRCSIHNKKVGGAKRSRHVYGDAFDVRIPRGPEQEHFIKLAKLMGWNGIGRYDTFVHIDRRTKPAEWNG